MNLNKYTELTIRTLAPNENILEQEVHLTLGINGELLGEVFPILAAGMANKDKLEEELGDVMWYIGAYFNIKGFDPKPYPAKPINGIAKELGDLVEGLKKEWIYKKEFKDSLKEEHLQKITSHIMRICSNYGIDFEDMLEKNINKLKIRYPFRFEAELAISKDTETEQKLFKDGTDTKTKASVGEVKEGLGED